MRDSASAIQTQRCQRVVYPSCCACSFPCIVSSVQWSPVIVYETFVAVFSSCFVLKLHPLIRVFVYVFSGDTCLQADQDGAPSGPHGNSDPEQLARVVESFRLCFPWQTWYPPSFRSRVRQSHQGWRLRQCEASCGLPSALCLNTPILHVFWHA